MNEKDYIDFNNLLTKYRVKVLRMLGQTKDASSSASKTLIKQLRSIDYLRNNMVLCIDTNGEGVIYAEEKKVSE